MQGSSSLAGGRLVVAEWTAERLDSWKEIASFFRREVRTVQLWEKSEGLPVRRQHHQKKGSVYAYRRELEAWWIARSAMNEGYGSRQTVAPSEPRAAVGTRSMEREGARILVFPLAVMHTPGDGGPARQTVNRFAEGLGEDLTLELRRVGLSPICLAMGALPSAGSSSPAFMKNMATEFGSAFFLCGSIRYAGSRLRVVARLVRSADLACLWTDRFELGTEDMLNTQAELARAVSQRLPEQMVEATSAAMGQGVRDETPSHHACMLGLHFWKQRRGTELARAAVYFEDAIALDPECAEAYAGLADTFVSLSHNHLMPPREATANARLAVEKGLALMPRSVEVRNAWLNLLIHCAWDWPAAEEACKRMVDSGLMDSRTLQLYASLMINLGRHDEAIRLSLHAQRLDPLSDLINGQVSFAYFYAGDYGSALSFIRRTIELQPKFIMGHALLGRTEAERGKWEEAIAAFERGLAIARHSPCLKALLAYGHAGLGDKATANRILREIEREGPAECFPAYDVSAVHAILNQEKEALQNILRAYKMRDIKMTYMRHDPRFARLRGMAQFRHIASSIYDTRADLSAGSHFV